MKKLIVFFLTCSFLYGEFIKSENIVVDKNTNLMWQDNIEVTYEEDITMGNVYCDELVLNGYIDWRMATIKELQLLIDQNAKEHYLDKTFVFLESGKYWSSTPNITNKQNHWYVDFSNGKVSSESKSKANHIRCVRDVK